MKACIVVRGKTDADILRAALPKELKEGVELVIAGERSTPVSVARTLLITGRKPVALVLDANSMEEAAVRPMTADTEWLLRMVAGGIPTKAIFAVPQIEVIFFQAPHLIEKVFGPGVASEVLQLSRAAPRQGLALLCQRPGAPPDLHSILSRLDENDREALRATPLIRELIAFLTKAADAAPRRSAM